MRLSSPPTRFRVPRTSGLRGRWLVCGLAALVGGGVAFARALDAAEIGGMTRVLQSTRVTEVPASVAQFIANAPAGERSEVAAVAVVAAIKAYPALAGTCVLAAVRTAPEVTETVVLAALEASPACALAVVSAAAENEGDTPERIIAVAARRFPTRVAQFEREVAIVRARRAAEAGGVPLLGLPRALLVKPGDPSDASTPRAPAPDDGSPL